MGASSSSPFPLQTFLSDAARVTSHECRWPRVHWPKGPAVPTQTVTYTAVVKAGPRHAASGFMNTMFDPQSKTKPVWTRNILASDNWGWQALWHPLWDFSHLSCVSKCCKSLAYFSAIFPFLFRRACTHPCVSQEKQKKKPSFFQREPVESLCKSPQRGQFQDTNTCFSCFLKTRENRQRYSF